MMDYEEMFQQIAKIVVEIEDLAISMDKNLEKLEIVLTGALRLLSGETTVLKELRGNPEAIKGYILREVSGLRASTSRGWDKLLASVKALQEDLRNQ